jgi:pyruvate/2-oxoacid:ferredoxin oxidoreductase alpha subunit
MHLLQIGKGVVRRQGKDVCLLAYGSMVNEALVAADLLARSGVSATVVDARFCKPLDTQLIRQCVKEHPAMVSVEEGSIGGFAAHVMQVGGALCVGAAVCGWMGAEWEGAAAVMVGGGGRGMGSGSGRVSADSCQAMVCRLENA